MERKAYADMVAVQVAEILGDGYEVKATEVIKNNNIKKTGIIIRKTTENISPIIYIDEMQDNDLTTASAAKKVVELYMKNSGLNVDANEIISTIRNEDKLLKAVLPKLVNANQSEEYISVPFLDMKVQFYIRPTTESSGTLRKEMTKIDPQELLKAAVNNMVATKEDMSAMLAMMGAPVPMFGEGPKMLVASNEEKTLGAACILNNNFVREIAMEFDDDVIILPSSIHEVICMPFSEMEDNPMVRIVRDVNRTVLDPAEILSDNVYIYRRINDEIEIIKED